MKTYFPVVLMLLFLGAATASAQLKLGDFDPGRVVTGDAVDVKALAGRVVVVDYWGTR